MIKLTYEFDSQVDLENHVKLSTKNVLAVGMVNDWYNTLRNVLKHCDVSNEVERQLILIMNDMYDIIEE